MAQTVTTHTHTAVTITDHVAHILGVTTTTALVVGIKASVANQVTIYKTNATGGGLAIVQLQSYSYDGVIHKDSYVSDI